MTIDSPKRQNHWTHIAMMRGRGWLAADLPGHLIIRTAEFPDQTPTLQGDVLTINPVVCKAWLRSPDGREETLVFKRYSQWQAFSFDGLPPIVTSSDLKLMDARDAVTQLPFEGAVLMAGHCGWFGERWSASPSGHRDELGKWRAFLPTGGRGGIAFPLNDSPGKSIEDMSELSLETQLIAMLEEKISTLYHQLADKTFIIAEEQLETAMLLVILRRAISPRLLNIVSHSKLSPPWQRLLEHLAAKRVTPAQNGLDLRTLTPVLAGIDLDLLWQQINRHSQVIPPSLRGVSD